MMMQLTAGALFGATAAAAVGPSGGIDTPHPITLVIADSREGVKVTVAGRSDVAIRARYTLTVQTDRGSGGNRSRQSGVVTLVPGRPMTVLTSSGARHGGRDWTATLDVVPATGDPYRIVRAGPPHHNGTAR